MGGARLALFLLLVWVSPALSQRNSRWSTNYGTGRDPEAGLWDQANDPALLDKNYTFESKFDSLPLTGSVLLNPWSDTYWPFNKDIFKGRYDYPTTNSEWKRTSPRDESWEGMCDGWTVASVQFGEPSPLNFTNPDGILVPFGSSDIKALLMYWVQVYGRKHQREFGFVGQRCKTTLTKGVENSQSMTPVCADVDAGAFHIALANQLGFRHESFSLDRTRDLEVWNQPIFSFRSRVLSRQSNQISVTTDVTYGVETQPQWLPHPPASQTETYQYTLQLNTQGKIIGGQWATWMRPDFVWREFTHDPYGYFEVLKTMVPFSHTGSNYTRRGLPSGADFLAVNYRSSTLSCTNEISPGPVQSVLEPASGQFSVRLHSNTTHDCQTGWAWTIAPESLPRAIVVGFNDFGTNRYREMVKIFEATPVGGGGYALGALLAVLHGTELPVPIEIMSPAAYVSFECDQYDEIDPSTRRGFEAWYTAVY